MKSVGAFHKKRMLFIIRFMSFRVIIKYRSFDIRETKHFKSDTGIMWIQTMKSTLRFQEGNIKNIGPCGPELIGHLGNYKI